MSDDLEGLRELVGQEEKDYQETAVARLKRKIKAAGGKIPRPTNFPVKGENEDITLANSKFEEFPFSRARSIKFNMKHLWAMAGSGKDKNYLLWIKANDGDYTKPVESWIKRRESWAAKKKRVKTLHDVMQAVKWGVVLPPGLNYMNNLIDAGITGSDSNLPHLSADSESSEA